MLLLRIRMIREVEADLTPYLMAPNGSSSSEPRISSQAIAFCVTGPHLLVTYLER
jgi:hypothetical protein